MIDTIIIQDLPADPLGMGSKSEKTKFDFWKFFSQHLIIGGLLNKKGNGAFSHDKLIHRIH